MVLMGGRKGSMLVFFRFFFGNLPCFFFLLFFVFFLAILRTVIRFVASCLLP